jgi:hypothetical protein
MGLLRKRKFYSLLFLFSDHPNAAVLSHGMWNGGTGSEIDSGRSPQSPVSLMTESPRSICWRASNKAPRAYPTSNIVAKLSARSDFRHTRPLQSCACTTRSHISWWDNLARLSSTRIRVRQATLFTSSSLSSTTLLTSLLQQDLRELHQANGPIQSKLRFSSSYEHG